MYDQKGNKPGASGEIDAIAHAAAAEIEGDKRTSNDVNSDDPGNKHQCPAGNSEDPAYNPGRKI